MSTTNASMLEALLARAARLLRNEFAPVSVSFRLDDDAYDHEARFEWPGQVAVYWNDEPQCRSANGDPLSIASADTELREAGIDRPRADRLLGKASDALRQKRSTWQRQLLGLRTGRTTYLIEFLWPGFVRVRDFRSHAVVVESALGKPFEASSASADQALAPVEVQRVRDESEPLALVQARERKRLRDLARVSNVAPSTTGRDS